MCLTTYIASAESLEGRFSGILASDPVASSSRLNQTPVNDSVTSPAELTQIYNGDFTNITDPGRYSATNPSGWNDGNIEYFRSYVEADLAKVSNWSAYRGSGINVWKYNIGVEVVKIVQLYGLSGNIGITQKITNPNVGSYLLKWSQCGTGNANTGNSPFKIIVYSKPKGSGASAPETLIFNSGDIAASDKTAWTDKVLSFQLTQANIFDSSNIAKDIYLAFIPLGYPNGRGALIDKVGLCPLDLDIQYLSQAETKELGESREDIGDGGYISLQSYTPQSENITPITYLVIKAIAGLPSTAKVRLKFSSSNRYIIAKDLLGNNKILNGSTEFPAGQETRLYLVGLSKSLTRGSEKITMQVLHGGLWIDGDSLKATCVQTQFQVDLRVFIPYNWVNIPHPLYTHLVAKGDTRGFDPGLNGTYRVAQSAIINTYSEWIPDVKNRIIDNWNSAGVSEHYSEDDVHNFDDEALHSEDTFYKPSYIKSNATLIRSGTADITNVDSFAVNTGPTGSSGSTQTFMKFVGSAAEPIVIGAANIDWRIFVGISINNPLKPQFVMQGVHDGFPAYEIYINSNHTIFQHTNVLQWSPNLKDGVEALIGYPDVTLPQKTGLINQ